MEDSKLIALHNDLAAQADARGRRGGLGGRTGRLRIAGLKEAAREFGMQVDDPATDKKRFPLVAFIPEGFEDSSFSGATEETAGFGSHRILNDSDEEDSNEEGSDSSSSSDSDSDDSSSDSDSDDSSSDSDSDDSGSDSEGPARKKRKRAVPMSTPFRHVVPGGADLLEHLSPALRAYSEGGKLRALDCACGGELKAAKLRMLPKTPGAGKEFSLKKGIVVLALGLLAPFDGSKDGTTPRIVVCLQKRSSGAVVVGEVLRGCIVRKKTELRFGALPVTEELACVRADVSSTATTTNGGACTKSTRDVAEGASALCNSSYIRFGEVVALSCAPGAMLKRARLHPLKGGGVIKLPRQGAAAMGKKKKKKKGKNESKGLSLVCLSLRRSYKGKRGEVPAIIACVQDEGSGCVTVGELTSGCIVKKGTEARLSSCPC